MTQKQVTLNEKEIAYLLKALSFYKKEVIEKGSLGWHEDALCIDGLAETLRAAK